MKKYITVVAALLCFIAQSYAAVTYKEDKTICENSTFPTFRATNTAADDYFWYEIGDVIGIGNADALYYCFPKKQGVVSKTRLATEELFKINKANNARK